jgi:hypothetical protein
MADMMTLTNETPSYGSTGIVFPVPEESGYGSSFDFSEIDYPKQTAWIDLVYPIGREKSTSQATEIVPTEWETGFIPRTALGKKLESLRTRAISSGMRLLTEDEVLEEVKRRRGEIEDNEANLY